MRVVSCCRIWYDDVSCLEGEPSFVSNVCLLSEEGQRFMDTLR